MIISHLVVQISLDLVDHEAKWESNLYNSLDLLWSLLLFESYSNVEVLGFLGPN